MCIPREQTSYAFPITFNTEFNWLSQYWNKWLNAKKIWPQNTFIIPLIGVFCFYSSNGIHICNFSSIHIATILLFQLSLCRSSFFFSLCCCCYCCSCARWRRRSVEPLVAVVVVFLFPIGETCKIKGWIKTLFNWKPNTNENSKTWSGKNRKKNWKRWKKIRRTKWNS